uniref:Uncharacterized protein n=1 Tax=Populus alba TaxID=43335 RepID=A0A4U5PZM1_POPAL|nr:hypothetical protein D5086_0000160520 [Populus alba]
MDAMGNAVPNIDLYNTILKLVKAKAEDYLGELVSSVFIRIYLLGRYESSDCSLSEDEIYNRIWEFISAGISAGEPVEVKSMVRKRPYPNYITALKPTSKESNLNCRTQAPVSRSFWNLQFICMASVMRIFCVPLLMMHWGQVYVSSVDQRFQGLLSDLSPGSTSADAINSSEKSETDTVRPYNRIPILVVGGSESTVFSLNVINHR